MALDYELARNIIILEFGLVIFLIILTFLLKAYYAWRSKKVQETIKQMDAYLANAKAGQALNFPYKWRKLEYIIPIIKKYDASLDYPWKEVRKDLLETIVLPLARKAANKSHRHWIKRFYAAEAFSLAPHKEDEEYIVKLVNDSIPLVYLNALEAAVASNSKAAIVSIVTQAAAQRRLTQDAYINAFTHASPEVEEVIVNYLNETKDPFTRAACYKILIQCPTKAQTFTMAEDLSSTNLELRLAAIRYLCAKNKNASIPIITTLLEDPIWQVRAAAINCLGSLNAKDSIPNIEKCLRDSQWWVRIAAGTVLKNMGSEGIDVLKKQDPSTDKFAYDVAQFLLVKE